MKIETAQISHIGGRQHNDDTAGILQQGGTYVYVGDGLGGYAGGAQASQAAWEALLAQAKKGGMTDSATMTRAAEAADRAVRDLQERTGGDMKTTQVFLALEKGRAMWMHTGDSRLYHFHGGTIAAQTVDHSVSQLAVLMGQITQREIRFHPDRNRVLRALGAQDARAVVSGAVEVKAGDAFLLCTDGFWEYVYEEEMEQTLANAKDAQSWLEAMTALLRSRIPHNTDNYTAAAVFCK